MNSLVVLCKIAQVDCKHDFGENARRDYHLKDRGCDEYSVNEAGLTAGSVGYYTGYTIYRSGTREIPGLTITRENPFNILSRLPVLPIVCDFIVGPFIEDLYGLRNKVVWISNNETKFDAASKGTYGFEPVQIDTSTHYQKSPTFIPFEVINVETSHFYLSKYRGAKMFGRDGKTYVAFNEANKIFLVDREYCKNNGVVNKIITGPNKTINYAMNQIRGILNGTLEKQGSQFLKYISKRLGDQGQAISALRTYEGNRCIFVTHDTVARDFAITIGAPYVVWTYSGNSDADKGYYLFVNQRMLTPEEIESQRRRAQEELERARAENFAKREALNRKINEARGAIEAALITPIRSENDVKNVLKQIVNYVYFLDTYGNKLRNDVSGINLESIEVVDFPQTKEKFDNMRLQWSANIDYRSINITGIKNTYLCADELIKIYNILEKNNRVLLDKYVDFINKIIEIINAFPESSRAAGMYKKNAATFLSNLIVGLRGGGIQTGGGPDGHDRTSPKNRSKMFMESRERRKKISDKLREDRKKERFAEFRKLSLPEDEEKERFAENFFSVDESIHAFIYLVAELVNMFRDNIKNHGFNNYVKITFPEISTILNTIEYRNYNSTKEKVGNEDEYNFTLPFENNIYVKDFLQYFIDYYEDNIIDESYDATEYVVRMVGVLYSNILPTIEYWKENYNNFNIRPAASVPGGDEDMMEVDNSAAAAAAAAPAKNLHTLIRPDGAPRWRPRGDEDMMEVDNSAAAAAAAWAGGNRYTRKRRIHVKIRRNGVKTSKRRTKTLKHTRRR